MDSFGRFVAILMAVIMVGFIPFQYSAQLQGENIDNYIKAKTEEFTQTIRQEAQITLDRYEDFCDTLHATDNMYDVDIRIASPLSGKDLGSLSDEGTSDVAMVNNPELTAHIHTDDCYAGHRHKESGCIFSGDVTKQIIIERIHTFSSSNTYSNYYMVTCATCGKLLFTFSYNVNNDYRTGSCLHYCSYNTSGQPITTQYNLPRYGYRSNSVYDNFDLKLQYMMVNAGYTENTNSYIKSNPTSWSGGTIPIYSDGQSGDTNPAMYLPWLGCVYCGKYGVNYSCGLTQDELPICDKVVTGITATCPSQTVILGGSIITTATATYLDGHTGTVNCTASGFDANKIGTQTVTLTYSGLVGNAKTTGTRTCTITVVVNSHATLSSLAVTPSSATVYNGTEPAYTVAAVYSDGTTKTLSPEQYTKAGWSDGPGTKTVTFSYTEDDKTVTTTVVITVKPNLTYVRAAPQSQSVVRYSSPDLTVTAYYEDGSTAQVTDYSLTGFDKTALGSQTVTVEYTENGITKTDTIEITVTHLTKTCAECGMTYELDDNDSDRGCPNCRSTLVSITASPSYSIVNKGEMPDIEVTATFLDGHTETVDGWTSTFIPDVVGFQTVTISYLDKTADVTVYVIDTITCSVCGTEYSRTVDGNDPGCPICSKKVVSITASPKTFTMEANSQMPITVTALYADGHTGEVTDWASDLPLGQYGTFVVTVSYKGCTDTVTATVSNPGFIHCPVCGLDYDPYKNPHGCPVCSVTLTGIEAYPANESYQVYPGTQLKLEIVLIYADGHKTAVYDGYSVTNYDPEVIGIQTVTVSYSEFSTELTIEVVKGAMMVTCPNGHEYYTNEDGSDPGCPFCNQEDGAEEYDFLIIKNNTEIVNELYDNGIVYLNPGDYLTVTVTRKNETLYERFRSVIAGADVRYGEKVISGGAVDPIVTDVKTQLVGENIMSTCKNGHRYLLNPDGSDPGCPICSSPD